MYVKIFFGLMFNFNLNINIKMYTSTVELELGYQQYHAFSLVINNVSYIIIII